MFFPSFFHAAVSQIRIISNALVHLFLSVYKSDGKENNCPSNTGKNRTILYHRKLFVH